MANLQEAIKLTNYLLKERGLSGWTVIITKSKRSAGYCNYMKKQIGLSSFVIPSHTEESSFDTVTHEVAHAIAGKEAGHGYEWKRIHKELGGSGLRTYGKDSYINGEEPEHLKCKPRSESPYVGTCPNGHIINRFRLPKVMCSCSRCCPGRFNSDYKIIWKRR